MDKTFPNYILYANEGIWVSSKEKRKPGIVQILVWATVILIVLFSLIVETNVFAELSIGYQILFVILVLVFGFRRSPDVMVENPIEIHFYDDYFLFVLPEGKPTWKRATKVVTVMKYTDVTKCIYKTCVKRMQIYGDGTDYYYDKQPDGTIPTEPTKVKHFQGGMFFWNTHMDTVDFKREIEAHSPLRVVETDD